MGHVEGQKALEAGAEGGAGEDSWTGYRRVGRYWIGGGEAVDLPEDDAVLFAGCAGCGRVGEDEVIVEADAARMGSMSSSRVSAEYLTNQRSRRALLCLRTGDSERWSPYLCLRLHLALRAQPTSDQTVSMCPLEKS